MAVPPLTHVPRTKRGVLSYAARDIGERLEAKALVAFTQSGDTVRRLARLHTPLPLLAFTPLKETVNQLALTWGTKTFLVDSVDSTDAMVELVDKAMLQVPGYHEGDTLVIVAGSPPNTSGSTNLIRVHRLGIQRLTGHGQARCLEIEFDADGVPRGQAVLDALVGLLDLERLEDDLFRGVSPDSSPVRVFGGQVAAQALIAAGRTVPADRRVHSLHAYFLRPGDPQIPIVYRGGPHS